MKKSRMLTYFFRKRNISPEEINNILEEKGSSLLKQKVKMKSILSDLIFGWKIYFW